MTVAMQDGMPRHPLDEQVAGGFRFNWPARRSWRPSTKSRADLTKDQTLASRYFSQIRTVCAP